MSRGSSLASRRPSEAAKVLPRLEVLMPRLGLASVLMLSYATISLFMTFIHSSLVYMCLRPLRQNFIYASMNKTAFLKAS